MRVEAEVSGMSVAKSGIIEVRWEVRADKESGLSGHGVLRMREGLEVRQGQRLVIDVEPGPMVRHGKGENGVMDLASELPKAKGRVRARRTK